MIRVTNPVTKGRDAVEQRTLKAIREAAGKLQRDAADALGVTIQAYGRKESGKRELKPAEVIILAELFGVSSESILRARKVTESDTKTPGGDEK